MEEKILNIYGSEEKLRDVAEKAEKNLKTYEIEKNGTIQGEVKALDEKEARIMVSERYGEDNFRLIEREPKMENEEEADKDKMKGDKVVNALDDEKKETLVEEVEEHQTSYKELAGKLLQDKYFEYLLNEKQNNAVADYLINNPDTEPIKLTPQDNLALAERWQQEINNPTEMSKGMTINQIAEKEANYHSLYNHGMKQIQNLQKMETLTPQEKVQELFNEIKETFSPIEKAFFQRKLENTSPAGGWQLGNFLDHSGITLQEQEKVNSFFAEKVSPIFQKENDNIHRELYNKTELDNDFIKEVNPIFLDVDIKREKEMEQPPKNMEKQQERTQPQQEKKFDVAEYLNNQMKYLGFGDNHKEAIQKGIDSKDNSFQIHTTSDKALFGNKAEFAVNFNKSEKGGVFLNSFDAKLTTSKGEERSQNFRLNFTAKEAINLLEGRAVKTELQNKQGEKFNAFVKLNFAEEKNEFGNYKSKLFNENYGVDTGKIVDELKLKFDKPEYRENAIKALEKGNIIKAKFEHEGKEIQGKAFLNVEYKTLNLYDEKMTRLNTNKPLQGLEQDNSHEKNNIRQQNISRSL